MKTTSELKQIAKCSYKQFHYLENMAETPQSSLYHGIKFDMLIENGPCSDNRKRSINGNRQHLTPTIYIQHDLTT